MTYVFEDKLFGSIIKITLLNIDPHLADMIAFDAYDEGLRLQKIFNFFDSESELSTLNKKRKLVCSSDLIQVIKEALHFCSLTDGRYDISLGNLFRERKNHLSEHNSSCSYKDIFIENNIITLLHDDVMIDLSSIAKGYIVDKIVEYLQMRGVESGIVNGRGDIRVFGSCNEKIHIQHPRNTDDYIGSVNVKNESIATSGDYKQYNINYDTSHIINNNYFSSITVIADTLAFADLFATVLSVSEKFQVTKLLSFYPNLKVILVSKDLHIETHHVNLK